MDEIVKKVKTVILVMFENRSFDHMLGHLSFEGINPTVDGLNDPLDSPDYTNSAKNGNSYSPFPMTGDSRLPYDFPHEEKYISIQMAQNPKTKNFTMSGFVESSSLINGSDDNPDSLPMGFFSSTLAPITSFLAQNFCVCDRWFSPIPTGTQPNRTMAFSGNTEINDNATLLVPIGDDNIFKWMKDNSIRWRVYHDGMSFFNLYSKLWKYTFSDKFRDFEYFHSDLKEDISSTDPQVIIVEPSYGDAPHIGSDYPNDNHAPLAISWGEGLLKDIYEAVINNEERWKETVMVVYYDEHGGFYDHVKPPKFKYRTTANPSHEFNSLGPRIPGIIISPFVKQGSVCSNIFDHTSVLQFLAEVFTPDNAYSSTVEVRAGQVVQYNNDPVQIESISVALDNEDYWNPPSAPFHNIEEKPNIGDAIKNAPESPVAQAFEYTANKMIEDAPEETKNKYPELFQWQDAVKNARGN